MRSASASLKSIGLTFLWVAVLGVVAGAPDVAKSAPAAATASSDDPQQAADRTPSAQSEETTEPTAEPRPDAEEVADDGREWIMDEAAGRRYTIEKFRKVRGTYIWRDENHIRLPGGLFKVEVVKHDEQWFWVKIWEPQKRTDRGPRIRPIPTQEELDSVAENYVMPAGAGDRVRLEPFDEGLPQTGQWRQGFDVADMNHDGHLDIVFGPSRKGRATPNIFLGDSRGHWRRWSEARYPRLPYDYGDAAVADFNGDGHQDVAFGFHLRGMLALVGDGKGGFEPWTDGLELDNPGQGGDATAFSSRAIEAIDWNRDGRPDLIALGEGPKGVKLVPGAGKGTMINTATSFALFVNNGDGSWSRQPIEDRTGDFGDDFAIGDFDRDGRPDLAVASRRRGTREILRISSTGQGDLLAAQQVAPLRPNSALTSVAAADLDGDGFEEFLLGYVNRELDVWRTGIDLYRGNPKDGWQRTAVGVEESRAGVWDMAVGDVDGDGARDLVGLTGDGAAWVFLGDRQGSFVGEASPELPSRVKGCEGSEVRLIDLDGDGRDEVLASFAGEPTGPAGLPGVISFPGCPGQGRIYAWRVVSLDSEPAATEPGAAGR